MHFFNDEKKDVPKGNNTGSTTFATKHLVAIPQSWGKNVSEQLQNWTVHSTKQIVDFLYKIDNGVHFSTKLIQLKK